MRSQVLPVGLWLHTGVATQEASKGLPWDHRRSVVFFCSYITCVCILATVLHPVQLEIFVGRTYLQTPLSALLLGAKSHVKNIMVINDDHVHWYGKVLSFSRAQPGIIHQIAASRELTTCGTKVKWDQGLDTSLGGSSRERLLKRCLRMLLLETNAVFIFGTFYFVKANIFYRFLWMKTGTDVGLCKSGELIILYVEEYI